MSVLHRPVLVVDDSAVVRNVIRDQLRQEGVQQVVLAGNAEEAVARFEEHRPGLVLLDITMPQVPGTRVAHHVLKSEPRTKVVLVTAMSRDKDLVESAIASGAYGYLRKPVEHAELKALLDRVRDEERGSGGMIHPWGKGPDPEPAGAAKSA